MWSANKDPSEAGLTGRKWGVNQLTQEVHFGSVQPKDSFQQMLFYNRNRQAFSVKDQKLLNSDEIARKQSGK